MNTPRDEEPERELEGIRDRVQQVCTQVNGHIARTEQRRCVVLTIGLFLSVLCTVSLSVLTSMAFRLDAEALTQVGRHEVERNLPASRRVVRDVLEANAPEITASAIEGLISALPHLRPLVVRHLEDNLRGVTREFEDRLVELTDAAVTATRADLDREFPELSESEKLELLSATLAAKFKDNLTTLYEELHPRYEEEIRRVERYVLHLRDADPAGLSPKEQAERELIVTLLQLMTREPGF